MALPGTTRGDRPGTPPDEQPTAPTVPQVFAGRYQVILELGRGGMGRVLRARDLKLGREVALKLMVHGALDQQQRQRFEQEARAAGALNHPNIVDVHDIGEENGEPYIVTELLEGRTLHSVLAAGPLTPHEALRLATQLADGLAAAHAKGIIHRDVKPENLFLTDGGRLKILDFGIAKLPRPAGGGLRTDTGAILGTPGYMSPEQVRGEPADARSDVFAIGAVLYEMLAGSAPFARASSTDSAYAVLHDPQAALPASTPALAARIVARCLEKDPAARYADAGEVLKDFGEGRRVAEPRRRSRLLLIAALCGLGAAFALATWLRRPVGPAPAAAAPSVAVLPFADMSAQKDQEYFSDGIAEEILSALAQVPGLRVAARTSAFAFKGKNEDTGAIAGKLHVATILEGSVRKAGDRIRITTQLINAADGYHLWSETYDRELIDVFAVQDEIARAVVAALKLKLLPAPTSKDRRTAEPEAYNQYLLGRQFYLHNNVDGFRRAVQAYEKAVQLDPGYAPAWAGFALARFRLADLADGGDAATPADSQRFASGLRQALEAAEKPSVSAEISPMGT